VKFSIISNAPDWVLQDSELYEEWKSEYFDLHIRIKEIERNIIRDVDMARSEFQRKVKGINDNYDSMKFEIFRSKPLLAINYITVQSLPIDVTSETLSMSDSDRKERLTILLAEYKNDLYRKFKDGSISEEDIHNLLLTD